MYYRQYQTLALWIHLLEHIPQEKTTELNHTNLSVLKKMIGFIQQNYAEKITLSDISAAGTVGQSKCCILFKKYTGQTPNDYLIQYRINKSIELLKNTDMSITEISTTIGFSGSSYYSETFRKYLGETPTSYRKNKATR